MSRRKGTREQLSSIAMRSTLLFADKKFLQKNFLRESLPPLRRTPRSRAAYSAKVCLPSRSSVCSTPAAYHGDESAGSSRVRRDQCIENKHLQRRGSERLFHVSCVRTTKYTIHTTQSRFIIFLHLPATNKQMKCGVLPFPRVNPASVAV